MSDQLILRHDIDVFLPVSGMVGLRRYVSLMIVMVIPFDGIAFDELSWVVIVVFVVVRTSLLIF